MSSDISGATLMAIGSSAPELAVMIISVLKPGNHEAIGIGTIVGSALFNLFIITGAVMIIKTNAKLQWQPLIRDLLFYALSILVLLFAFKNGKVSFFEASLFVLVYVIYIFALYKWKKIFPYKDVEKHENQINENGGNKLERIARKFLDLNFYIVFLLSIGLIGVLSWLLVESAIGISEAINIPEFIVALTVIAMGTSIPDLVSSVIVAKQGRAGMAIVNGIGSNIFDVLIGLGLPFLLLFAFTAQNVVYVYASELNIAFAFLMGSIIILLVIFLITKWKTKRFVGIILIVLYVIYLSYEVILDSQ